MARNGVDYETVKHTAVKLLSQGIPPSVQKLRETLGTGSNTTLAMHLKAWREEQASQPVHHLPPTLPKELIGPVEVLWQTAIEQAQQQFVAYKSSMAEKFELAQLAQRESEQHYQQLKQAHQQLHEAHEQQQADNENKCVALLRMRFGRRDPSAPFALARRLYHAAAVRVTGATCTSHTAHRLSHDSTPA